MTDWIRALSEFSQEQISAACDEYIRNSEWRPRPVDIINLIKSQRGKGSSRLSNLTASEAEKVSEVLSNARNHIKTYPEGTALHDAGLATIAYWEGHQ